MRGGASGTAGVITGMGADAITPAEFADAVMGVLCGAVPFDGYCLFGTDPLSGVRAFMYSRHGLDGVAEQLTHNELVEVDVNRYRDLGTAPRPVGVMSTADRRGRASPRMQDLLRPTGFGAELRLVLRSAAGAFGGITLFRETGARPFSDADVERILQLSPALRQAVQRHPVRPTSVPTTALLTGVVLIDASNRVVGRTAAADRWLEELCVGGADEMVPADQMRMVLDVATASRAAGSTTVCRIRTATGRWLLVEAAPLDASTADTAITLRSADLASLLPAAAAWYGLTRREGHVLAGVGQGLPARHIARGLALAIPTVNAHLQSIYRKAGVTGREQLIASLT
jgi:DNA-binding CsgD family transcriptional regulator